MIQYPSFLHWPADLEIIIPAEHTNYKGPLSISDLLFDLGVITLIIPFANTVPMWNEQATGRY